MRVLTAVRKDILHKVIIDINGSLTLSMDGVARSMDFFEVGGPARDETGETHRRTNAFIHGWGKYPWMINFHEWGATDS